MVVLRPKHTKKFVLLLRRWLVERPLRLAELLTPAQQKLLAT
jgi:hypothetical protein